MNNGYGRFASFYDGLMEADYKKIADRIDEIVMENYGKRGILLDLACGTGSLCECMAEKGYDVIGTDISQEMLSVALDKKYDSGYNIQYLCQDMRKIDMYGTIDTTVCTLDSLNHLNSKEDILQTFKRVSLFCEPNGLFVFDINTPYKHKCVLGNNTFIFDNDEVYCVWQNFLGDDLSVEIQLDLFEKENAESESYTRVSEGFREISVDIEEIKSMLEECDFEILKIYDEYSDNSLGEKSERAVFVAKKIVRKANI